MDCPSLWSLCPLWPKLPSEHLFEDFRGVVDEPGADGSEEAFLGSLLGAFGGADVTAEQLFADDRVVALLESEEYLLRQEIAYLKQELRASRH